MVLIGLGRNILRVIVIYSIILRKALGGGVGRAAIWQSRLVFQESRCERKCGDITNPRKLAGVTATEELLLELFTINSKGISWAD
jgi:hypothetical protein